MTEEERGENGLELVRKLFAGLDTAGGKVPETLTDYAMRHVFGDL